MTLSLHTLRASKGARTKKTRVGRGNASGRGTTAGRGTKGQRARTGGRKRLKLKGLKQMLLSFPKTRGFRSRFPEVFAIRLDAIVKRFPNGGRVDIDALRKAELLPSRMNLAKVIGKGTVEQKMMLVGVGASASVKEAIEKVGGSVEAV